MAKRGRDEGDEEEIFAAVNELASTLGREQAALKIRALERVTYLLSPSDDLYVAHKSLLEADAAYYLVQLARDESVAVATKAAEAIAKLAAHSGAARARLAAGPLVGLESTVERALLNPVQGELVDQGAVAALSPLAVSGQEAAAGAASAALAALCSFNFDGKVAYLTELVAAAQAGRMRALPHLDTLLGGMECGSDEVAVLLDQLEAPLLEALRSPAPAVRLDGLSLLGTLCERRPGAVVALLDAGAAQLLADLLVRGSLEEQDLAAHGLWLVTRQDKSLLRAGGEGLECNAAQLAGSLLRLVETAAEEEEAAERAQEQAGDQASASGGAESDEDGGGGQGPSASGASDEEAPPRLDICYADEATKLLRELAAGHAEVAEMLEQSEVAASSRPGCCMM